LLRIVISMGSEDEHTVLNKFNPNFLYSSLVNMANLQNTINLNLNDCIFPHYLVIASLSYLILFSLNQKTTILHQM
jgi:hypothetical protein